jgi:hypothetical protein
MKKICLTLPKTRLKYLSFWQPSMGGNGLPEKKPSTPNYSNNQENELAIFNTINKLAKNGHEDAKAVLNNMKQHCEQFLKNR